MAERLYSTRQVADLLGVTPAAVTSWAHRGWLACENLPGAEVRVSETALVRFLRDRGINLEEIMARVTEREARREQPPPRRPAAPPAPSGEAQADETARREPAPAAAAATADPAADAVDAILTDALNRGASAVYFESGPDGLALRLRIGGRLYEKANFKFRLPAALRPQLIARLKAMANLEPAETRRPQQGPTTVRVNGTDLDLVVSTSSTPHGENAVVSVHSHVAARGR
jgi:type II secretory ATPase GspE/PulE/Tfp pilus assembly ATPase PilB-like protein